MKLTLKNKNYCKFMKLKINISNKTNYKKKLNNQIINNKSNRTIITFNRKIKIYKIQRHKNHYFCLQNEVF